MLAFYLVLACGVVAVRYLVLPSIDSYRGDIEAAASRALGAPVSIGKVAASWQGINPHLVLSQVDIQDSSGASALSLPTVSAVVSWRSVLSGVPRMRRLSIEDASLDVRRDADGKLWVAGLLVEDDDASDEPSALASWLVLQHEIVIQRSRLQWSDAQRGAPPLALSDVNLVIRNAGHRHQLGVQAVAPAALGGPVDFRADFSHPWFVDAADMRQWHGQAYAHASIADVSAWQPWVDLPVGLTAGRGEATMWLGMRQGRVEQVTADVDLRGIQTDLAAVGGGSDTAASTLDLARVSGRVDAVREGDDLRVAVENLAVLPHEGAAIVPGALLLRHRAATEEAPVRTDVEAGVLDIGALASLAKTLPLPAPLRQQVVALAPQGVLRDVKVGWDGGLAQPQNWRGGGRFESLTVAPAPVPTGRDAAEPQRPGGERLTGQFAFEGDGVRIGLDSRDATLSFPGVFADPTIAFQRLRADVRIGWPAQAPWRADIANIEFEQDRTAGRLKGSWHAGGKSPSGVLALSGGLDRGDARDVARFLPLEIDAEVRTWVRQAILGGRIEGGNFEVRGDLRDFPFANPSEGQFRIEAKVAGVVLDYGVEPELKSSPWPRLDAIDGTLVFERSGMRVVAERAQVRLPGEGNVRIGKTTARIADLDKAVLEVEGSASGPAASYLRFVSASPLREMLGGSLDEASLTGDLRMPLTLRIPLEDVEATTVRGTLDFNGNRMVLMPEVPTLENVTGKLVFTETGIAIPGIEARALGGPVSVSADAPVDGLSHLRFRGNATAAGLAAWADKPVGRRLSGEGHYQADVRFSTTGDLDVGIASDLQGLGLDAPAPLGKPASQSRPLSVNWSRRGSQAQARETWTVQDGNVLRGVLERQMRGEVMKTTRGVWSVQDRVPATPTLPARGLQIDAQSESVDLADWMAFLNELHPRPGSSNPAAPAATLPAPGRCVEDDSVELESVQIHVRTPSLYGHGRQFNNVDVRATCVDSAPRNWELDVDSDKVAGAIAWRVGGNGDSDRMTARLARLIIEDDESTEGQSVFDGDSVADMPEVDLQARQFVLHGRDLGALDVQASSRDAGREWHLGRLHIRNPDAELAGTGVWRVDPAAAGAGRRRMTLDASLSLHDAGRFLDRLKLQGTMRGGVGTLSGRVSWAGRPYSLDVPSLAGNLSMSLEKGQFLKAEPGIAKLLGVMSLQALPRRITLDFRDIFSEGFAYDSILANATIQDGVLRTDDFKMRGVPATVVMGGRVDLERETQDLRVVVVPEVNAGAASILYGLAVNPAIGLGTFLAQWVLRNPLNHAFTFEYAVKGSWTDPQVDRVQREPAAPPVSP